MRNRSSTVSILTVLAFLVAGCCGRPCRSSCDAAAPKTADATSRHFVVVRATRLEADEGVPQVLLETSLVTAPRRTAIPALTSAERQAVKRVPVWLAGTQVPDRTFGPRADVLAAPSIVTRVGEEATISMGEADARPGTFTGFEMRLETEGEEAGPLGLTLHYTRTNRGRVVRKLDAVRLEGPVGRVFIVEVASR